MFQLEVRVLEGRNMLHGDTFSSSDSYVEAGIRGGGQVYKTPVVQNSSNPMWNTPFTFTGARRDDILVLRIMDFDVKGVHGLLGEADVNLSPYLNQGWKDFWVQLWTQKRGFMSSIMRRGKQASWVRSPGDVHIQLNWVQLGGTQLNQQLPLGSAQTNQPALANTQPGLTGYGTTQTSQTLSGQPVNTNPLTTQSQSFGNQPISTQPQSLNNQPFSSQPQTFGNQPLSTQPQSLNNQPFSSQPQTFGNQPLSTQPQSLSNQPIGSQPYGTNPAHTTSNAIGFNSPMNPQPTSTSGSSFSTTQPVTPRIVTQPTSNDPRFVQ